MSRLTLEQIQALIPNQNQFISSLGLNPFAASDDDGVMRYLDSNGELVSRSGASELLDPNNLRDFQNRTLAGAGVLPMQGNWSTDYADLGQPIYATEQDYLRQLYGGGDQVGDYFVLPENNIEGRFVGTPLVNNRKSTAVQDFLKGAALLAGAGMGMNAISGALAGSGAGAGAGAGWTSGFDLPMGGLDASWGVNPAASAGQLGSGTFGMGSAPTFGGVSASGGSLGSGLAGMEGAAGLGGFSGAGSGLAAGMGELGSGTFGMSGAAPVYGGVSSTGGALGSGMAGVEGAGLGLGGMGWAPTTGTAGTAANAAQAGSALSRFLGGNSTTQDNLSLLGNLAGTGLGLLGARQQSNAMGDIANRYLDMGAPYRSLLQQSFQPGFSMANQPDFQNAMDVGAQAAARATSARVGNPVENPGAYAEMQKYITGSLALPQLNTYRSQLGTFGGMGVNQAGTAQMGQAQAKGGMYDALGYGIGQMTQPDNPFKGLLDQFRNQTINSTRSF